MCVLSVKNTRFAFVTIRSIYYMVVYICMFNDEIVVVIRLQFQTPFVH